MTKSSPNPTRSAATPAVAEERTPTATAAKPKVIARPQASGQKTSSSREVRR
jgi:hypothetical protein